MVGLTPVPYHSIPKGVGSGCGGGKETILEIIFELPGDRIYPYEHWINRLKDIFSERFSDVDYFMSLTRVKNGDNKGTPNGWFVTLPKKTRNSSSLKIL